MSISRENILKLQNGSDVRGVAVGGVEGQPVTLTGEAANRIAAAFARCFLKNPANPFMS